MAYDLSARNLEEMFALAGFDVPGDGMVFVGLRGTSPIDIGGTPFAASHKVEDKGVDYLHMRCSLIQWRPGRGDFAIFPGSTVPHADAIAGGVGQGGTGVNQLATCLLDKRPDTDRRHYRGDHGLSSPLGPHRAFRNDSKLPVWRTADDALYEGGDLVMASQAFDNIHCSRQSNVAAPKFSSNGCQVIAGVAGKPISAGVEAEQGPWLRFIRNGYGIEQSRFCYALFEEGEAQRTVTLGAASRTPTARFGSRGELVARLQAGLIAEGYDLGPAGADGDFGFATLEALRAFQLREFGPDGVDLVAGSMTAGRLGIAWPGPGQLGQDGAEPILGPEALAEGGVFNPDYGVTFSSLTPGGFFSSDPDDLSVKRSIRTNNPGALNITNWQKDFPGYVGVTGADAAGNRTTIYRTPEHGIGAWFHLLTDRYDYGPDGVVRIGELAKRYAGVQSENAAAARSYVAGWKRFSGDRLEAASTVTLSNDDEVLLLARAMFGHEIGDRSPLKDDQIRTALRLKREGALPA